MHGPEVPGDGFAGAGDDVVAMAAVAGRKQFLLRFVAAGFVAPVATVPPRVVPYLPF